MKPCIKPNVKTKTMKNSARQGYKNDTEVLSSKITQLASPEASSSGPGCSDAMFEHWTVGCPPRHQPTHLRPHTHTPTHTHGGRPMAGTLTSSRRREAGRGRVEGPGSQGVGGGWRRGRLWWRYTSDEQTATITTSSPPPHTPTTSPAVPRTPRNTHDFSQHYETQIAAQNTPQNQIYERRNTETTSPAGGMSNCLTPLKNCYTSLSVETLPKYVMKMKY